LAAQTEPREALPSPGVGLRHYAPRARLVLVESERPDPTGIGALEILESLIEEAALNWPGERVGVLLPARMTIDLSRNDSSLILRHWGVWSEPEELARNLYAGLHALDDEGCTVILCPLPPPEGIGAAIRDRLDKAGKRE
jgi:L-threonylcarbamoyladenylate synthase